MEKSIGKLTTVVVARQASRFYDLLVTTVSLLFLCAPAFAALTPAQSASFRSWFVRIVTEQVRRGPASQWAQRDCAGLVRYAVSEALKSHDARWKRAHGLAGEPLPPEFFGPEVSERLGDLSRLWMLPDGKARGSFVTALGIVQSNSELVARNINQASPGDLLFFDQGEDQHLMVFLGGDAVAYHTGHLTAKDNGMRLVSVMSLMHWKDTRWQPTIDNPNFIGVYRFGFLR